MMKCDTRGGHNRCKFNKHFFKTWSPSMSYVLGFIFADGAIIDARKSSRTCYVVLSNNDLHLLNEIKKKLNSNHPLQRRGPRMMFINNKEYQCKQSYRIRIGSKVMYQDLIKRGVVPRKSLDMILPYIPKKYFQFFLRGYFDGDGNLSIDIPKNRVSPRVRVTFISGSGPFLNKLVNRLKLYLKSSKGSTYIENGTFYLRFSKMDSFKILNYMYQNLDAAPYLEYKYKKFTNINN